jgi:mycothiol synthase
MRIEVKREIDAAARAAIDHLLHVATLADGHHPLSDHAWLDLVDGGRPGFAALVAWQAEHHHPVGYAQVSRAASGGHSWSIDLVIEPHHRMDGEGIGAQLLHEALAVIREQGGGHVHFWVSHPTAAHDRLAAGAGLATGRDLLQMRVGLPLAETSETSATSATSAISVRGFRAGEDEGAWVEVNNRAFDWHPEQGGWTLETVQRREQEPWFDPAGFLLHEREYKGELRLAGFCWTKIHSEEATTGEPVLGEIYVIAVHPDFQGLGLGRELVVAGLASLHQRGAPIGMLYVDAHNTAAVSLYERLGFHQNHLDRAYTADI